MSEELKKFQERSHKEITIFDFEGEPVPCIVIEPKKYDNLLSKVAGKPLSINTDLNILQDGLGHVFVELVLSFSQYGILEKILIDASKNFQFFQLLAKTSMFALMSPTSQYGKENIYMIQLPKPEKAKEALLIITKGLKPSEN